MSFDFVIFTVGLIIGIISPIIGAWLLELVDNRYETKRYQAVRELSAVLDSAMPFVLDGEIREAARKAQESAAKVLNR